MFSVIISEKGGAERREAFDRTEINVGRVQGNDLTLPKGNVSKRHARLLYRDGRFIVTDLKSTNGTYVNGRKIAQATIVREGDKIYIGDFVLRIETTPGLGSSSAPSIQPPSSQQDDSSAPSAPASAPLAHMFGQPATGQDALRAPNDAGGTTKGFPTPSGAPGAVSPSMVPSSSGGAEPPSSSSRPDFQKPLARPTTPRIEGRALDPKASESRQEIISHFPLENDPDEGMLYSVPGPPRVPSAPRPTLRPSVSPTPARGAGATATVSSGFPADRTPLSMQAERTTSPSAMGSLPSSGSPGRRAMPPSTHEAAARPSAPPARLNAHRAALHALIERTHESLDLRVLDSGALPDEAMIARVTQAIGERVAAMKAQEDTRGELDLDVLAAEARRELLEYGPLTSLLEDEDVTEIHIVRADYVVAMHGRREVPTEVGFSSEQAVARLVRRLCVAAGKPLGEGEVFAERRLPRGARMFAVLPPASAHGHMVVVRKPQRADLTLEDLVRSGTISRAMAGLFAQCVEARANILVTGALGAGATPLLGALAAAGSSEDRVIVLQEDDELIFNQPHTISILLGETPHDGARAVQAATRAHPDRLVVGAFAGSVAAEVVDAMGDGVDGVLAAARAPTLRQAVSRLTADLAATKPGVTPEIAREWLASAFDLAIEIARLRDGRLRVLRVCELAIDGGRIALRDVFTFAVERTAAGGAVEGTFYPTGHIPGIVEDLAARGVSIDASIFKRHASVRIEAPSSPTRST